jgi:hypothetical protein
MLEGWFFITAALLVLSGGAKIRDPEPTRGALRISGLPSARSLVYGVAAAEISVGTAVIAFGSPLVALAVGALYLGFAAFVAQALWRRLPLQSCGCFGRSDTPPGWLHLTVNLVTVGVAIGVAASGGSNLLSTLAAQPAAGLPYVGFVAVGAFLAALVLSELPARGRTT